MKFRRNFYEQYLLACRCVSPYWGCICNQHVIASRSERSKVRVSFYQGVRPQCLSPPPAQESHVLYADLLSAAVNVDMAEHNMYTRQIRYLHNIFITLFSNIYKISTYSQHKISLPAEQLNGETERLLHSVALTGFTVGLSGNRRRDSLLRWQRDIDLVGAYNWLFQDKEQLMYIL